MKPIQKLIDFMRTPRYNDRTMITETLVSLAIYGFAALSGAPIDQVEAFTTDDPNYFFVEMKFGTDTLGVQFGDTDPGVYVYGDDPETDAIETGVENRFNPNNRAITDAANALGCEMFEDGSANCEYAIPAPAFIKVGQFILHLK